MKGILESLLTMALWGSMATIAVLAVRPLVKKNSHRIMSLLWLVVMFRFLCPIAIESKILAAWSDKIPDVVNKVAQIEQRKEPKQNRTIQDREYVEEQRKDYVQKQRNDIQEQRRDYVPDTDAKVLDVNNTSQTNIVSTPSKEMTDDVWYADDNNIMFDNNAVEKNDSIVLADSNEVIEDQEYVDTNDSLALNALSMTDINENLPTFLSGVWLLGTIIFLTLGARRYYLISKSLKEAFFLQRWGKFLVMTSDISGVPMSFGIFHPGIYVPMSFEKKEISMNTDSFTDRQKNMILWHEAMHLKRHDPLMKLAVYVIFAIHWWNPIAWICVKCINQDIEMACDEMVLAHIGRQNRGEYAETLLNFATRSNGISLMASFGESHAESRIKNTLRYRKAPIWVTILTLLFALGLGGCLALKPVSGEERGDEQVNSEPDSEQGKIEQQSVLPSGEETEDIQDDQIREGEQNVLAATEYEGTFTSYQEAYKVIADKALEDKKAIPDLLLIYFNDDDIPDLIVDENLYIFKDGKVYCLNFDTSLYETGYLEKQGVMGYYDYQNGYVIFKINEDYGLQKVCGYSESVDDKCEYWDYTGDKLQMTEIKKNIEDYLNEGKQFYCYKGGYDELLFYLGLYDSHEDVSAKYTIVDSSHNIDHHKYVEQYERIVDQMATEYSKENLKYDFIFFNDDDIPDLVIDNPGHWISLYMFKDETVYTLLDKMEYGSGDCRYLGYFDRSGFIGKKYLYKNASDKIEVAYVINDQNGMDTISCTYNGEWKEEEDYSYTDFLSYNPQIENVQWYINNSVTSKETISDLGPYWTQKLCGIKTMEEIKVQLNAKYNAPLQEIIVPKDSLYEKFKDNTAKLYFEYYSCDTSYGPGFCMPDGCTLSELEEIIFLHYNLEWRQRDVQIDFNYLDCGLDGIPEMAIEFKGVGIYSMNEDDTLVLVIKEENGQLQCKYGYETWGRSGAVLNRAGVVASFGTGGAAYQGGEVGILDADVNCKWIYVLDREYCSTSYDSGLAGVSGTDMYRCSILMDGEKYLCYVSDDENTSNDELYQIMCEEENLKFMDMTREDICHPREIAPLREKVLEKYGCTKSCLEADQVFGASYAGGNIIETVFGSFANWD